MTESTHDATESTASRLLLRQAELGDIDAIIDIERAAYPGLKPYSRAQLTGILSRFPQGQVVAVRGGRVVGFSLSFRLGERIALRPHTWVEITGGGYASRHEEQGSFLYGMEVCVHPDFRRYRIGRRLYLRRQQLAEALNLKGIVFGGRIPTMARRQRRHGGPQAYFEVLQSGQLKDPVVSFQRDSGFEMLGLLPNYLPGDPETLGYAAHMLWRNPRYSDVSAIDRGTSATRDRVRVVSVQFLQRGVSSFREFADNITYFVDTVGSYHADFVCFPELMQLQLLSMHDLELSASEAVDALTGHREELDKMFSDLAVRYNVNIIGGSYPLRQADGSVRNSAFIYLRDGSVHVQDKLHPTPSEANWWAVEGGDRLDVIQTDCGPIGVMICYDSEFPELARHLIDQGAQMLFVPFCTDERQGYMRVRHCCQARAIENQCYVVMAGNVGNLPRVFNMDIQYAQSCILTPCDFPFARDGVAADTTPNVESVAIADLSLSALREARQRGTVRNLRDRRLDLYQVRWRAG
ncbi:MAG: nitrilase-related carbon-nitrogen hydrolase [Lysobacterales bacterium]